MFHTLDYRRLEHYYQQYVYTHLTHLFLHLISYDHYRKQRTYNQKLLKKLFINWIQLITLLNSNTPENTYEHSRQNIAQEKSITETINDELKNIVQIGHSKHKLFKSCCKSTEQHCCILFLSPKLIVNIERDVNNSITIF